MTEHDPINRMSDAPDFEHLRETSHHPTWWARVWPRIVRIFTNRTGITIGLALAIVVVLVLFFWSGG